MYKQFVLAASLGLASMTAQAQGLPGYPFVHVNASAVIDVVPDTGMVDFEISVTDGDVARAVASVEERLAEIRAILATNAVPEADFEIRDIRKDIKKGAAGAASLYEVRCGVKITVRNLTSWRNVVEPLLSKPDMDGFVAAFDTSEREKVEAGLMAVAVRKATRKAEALAAGFGRKLGPVTAVTSGELKNLTRSMNLAANDLRHSGAGQKPPADRADLLMILAVKMAQPVDVIFRLK